MAEKKVYHFTAEVKDVEIRKVEEITTEFKNKKGETVESTHILLTCDVGEDMDRVFFKDKNLTRLNRYKRGETGTFFVRIDVEEDFGSKAKLTVLDFTGLLPEEATADEPTASDSAAISEDAKPKRSKKS